MVFPRSPLGGQREARGWNGGRAAVFDVCATAQTKKPGRLLTSGLPKNGGYLLSQLVGQYHRRW